jgi:NAD-dependent dihydropyrimidine dehydrogenase PreA subunit
MSLMVLPECLGCGACEFACPRGAISQGTDFRVAYVVDPLLCNDCGDCIPVCPVDVLVEDPDWAVCFARGCPLSSTRYEGWDCTRGERYCPTCSTMLWRPPEGGEWRCPRCDESRKVSCPKIRKAEVTAG